MPDQAEERSEQIEPTRQLYTVTPLSALAYCSGAFGAAVSLASFVAYRRGVRRLQLEGITEDEAAKALPYAFQAFAIATSMVAGVGIAGAATLSALGLDIKSESQVSSVQEALQLLRLMEVARPIAQRCREFAANNLWSISGSGGSVDASGPEDAASVERLKAWVENGRTQQAGPDAGSDGSAAQR